MRQLTIPQPIADALDHGATLAISISGGKDSQALLSVLSREGHARGWSMIAVHADLGRAEWKETDGQVRQHCQRYGVELVVCSREKGDLFDRFEERLEALQGTGKPFWPSAMQRYCTSDLKRGPINKVLRQYSGTVISAEGIRGQESRARSKKPCWEERTGITTKAREGITWNAIHEWTEEDVWAEIGVTMEELEHRRQLYAKGQRFEALQNWPAHPVYVYGNRRVSCAFCILGCQNDLEVAARHQPETLDYLIQLERRSGATFKHGWSLDSLKPGAAKSEAA